MEMKGANKEDPDKPPANEVKVTSTTFMRTYLAYIARLFDEKHTKVTIKAMGNAIPRALNLGMLVRKRFRGIHQIAEISMVDTVGRFSDRKVGVVTIVLSKTPLDGSHVGYLGPLPDSEVEEYKAYVPGQALPASESSRGFRARLNRGLGRRPFGRRGYGQRYEGGYGQRYRGGYGNYQRGGYRPRNEYYS